MKKNQVTAARLPDWDFWRHMPTARVWEVCALSFNINPDSMKHSPDGWMSGPGSLPLFEPNSFPSKEVAEQFDKRLRLLVKHIANPAHFRPDTITMDNPGRSEVYLSDFAAWATREMQWGDLPPEFVVLAEKHDRDIQGSIWKAHDEIKHWEGLSDHGKPSEAKIREDRLIELNNKLAELEEQWTLQVPSEAEQAKWKAEGDALSEKEAKARHDKEGRYTLKEAANLIEQKTGERAKEMLKNLVQAVRDDVLPVYEPGKKAPYKCKVVREFYEEAYWYDMNTWLKNKAPLVDYEFPKPDSTAAKGEAVPVTSPSGESWEVKAKKVAQRIGLTRWARGERQITAHNICEEVTDELNKDKATHGLQGPRGAQNVRNVGLHKWKFIPPKDEKTMD